MKTTNLPGEIQSRDPDGQFIVAIPLLALTWQVVAIAPLTGYAAYELERRHGHSSSSFARSFNSAVHQIVQGAGGVSKYAGTSLAMGKKQIDARLPNSPDELLNDPDWKEITHPSAKENGHRTFENKETGEKLRYDEATPGASGHEEKSHWHPHNPDKTSRHDEYLDANGNPTPRNSEESHLYPS